MGMVSAEQGGPKVSEFEIHIPVCDRYWHPVSLTCTERCKDCGVILGTERYFKTGRTEASTQGPFCFECIKKEA